MTMYRYYYHYYYYYHCHFYYDYCYCCYSIITNVAIAVGDGFQCLLIFLCMLP